MFPSTLAYIVFDVILVLLTLFTLRSLEFSTAPHGYLTDRSHEDPSPPNTSHAQDRHLQRSLPLQELLEAKREDGNSCGNVAIDT